MVNKRVLNVIHVISLGAGVQSSTIALMAAHGEITPMPECAIFADTMSEPQSVYTWLDWLEKQLPFPVHRISKGDLGVVATTVRTSKTGSHWSGGQPPIYGIGDSGKATPMMRQCTTEFKINPIQSFYKKHYKKQNVVQWIGISTDEAHRMKPSRNEFVENRWPLIELEMKRYQCIQWMESHGYPKPPRSACVFCLSGETEVITKLGTKQIRDIVGFNELLVPIRNGNSFQQFGKYQISEIRNFGKQEIYNLTLQRGKSIKVIRCTAEHRWVIDKTFKFVNTIDLCRGDVLQSCTRPFVSSSGSPIQKSPFGVAQGFVFGDGSHGLQDGDRRPASVRLYGEKCNSLSPYFSKCQITNEDNPIVYGLPRFWKNLPPLDESRSFLLGWLSGYFAADGTVSITGSQATIYSSVKENIIFVKDVCYSLGCQAGPLLEKTRIGFGVSSVLYSTSLRISDFPIDFWILTHHRERIESRIQKERNSARNWQVVSVEATGVIDDVYCAVVPGVEMFTLADNMLTGNCPYQHDREWLRLKTEEPDDFQKAVEFERRMQVTKDAVGFTGEVRLHRSMKWIDEVEFDVNKNQGDMFGNECEGMCGV